MGSLSWTFNHILNLKKAIRLLIYMFKMHAKDSNMDKKFKAYLNLCFQGILMIVLALNKLWENLAVT